MSASLTGFKSSGGRNTDSQLHVFHVAVRKSESDRVTRAADGWLAAVLHERSRRATSAEAQEGHSAFPLWCVRMRSVTLQTDKSQVQKH